MIKQKRLAKGRSQEQLAEVSGLSVRTIQRIERGHNAGLESLKCIAASFSIPLAQLQSCGHDTDEQFLGSNPILPATNVKETAQFYHQQLGFEIETLWLNPPYAVVARGKTILEFGEGRKDYAGSGICNIFVSDVDLSYQEYKQKEVELIGDLADRDYGSRDFRVKDNNGNMLIFSSPLINRKQLITKGNTLATKKG